MFQSVLNKLNKFIGNKPKYTIKGREFIEIRLIAEGGYAYVYEVEDSISQHKFALKKVNIVNENVQKSLKNEIKYWSKVNNNKNIIKLLDYEFFDKFCLILMEYCEDKYFLIEESMHILREIANGINALHSQEIPVAHRDLKIENILKFGKTYKICDFGSATTETMDPNKHDKAYVLEQFSLYDKMTTFMYRPPEMCDQYSKYKVYNKVDVWMLGCIFYTILYKKHPFQDAQKLAIINAYYHIPEDEVNYPEKIVDFLRLLLTPDPDKRPSIQDVLYIINNFNSDEVKEIKQKQFKNSKKNTKATSDLISADEIYRVQQQILKDQQKKNRYKVKEYEPDFNEIFDDYKEPTTNKYDNFNYEPKGNKTNGNTNTNVSAPKNEAWLIDFNQEMNNNPNTSNNQPTSTTNNTNVFDFDFFDSGNNNVSTSNNIPTVEPFKQATEPFNIQPSTVDPFDFVNNKFSGSNNKTTATITTSKASNNYSNINRQAMPAFNTNNQNTFNQYINKPESTNYNNKNSNSNNTNTAKKEQDIYDFFK